MRRAGLSFCTHWLNFGEKHNDRSVTRVVSNLYGGVVLFCYRHRCGMAGNTGKNVAVAIDWRLGGPVVDPDVSDQFDAGGR